jgi:uncharacterized membrane protein HdeD (DUF308 family)
MDKNKIKQQKILAWVLLVCAGIIILAPILTHQVTNSTYFGLVFLAVGLFTLRKVKYLEKQSKN